ncbi:MAG: hypothetical protein AAFP90_20965 [Planctomycetota bacterium]
MAIHEMSLEACLHVDKERLQIVVDKELSRIIADLDDRPGVGAARSLTIKLDLKPIVDDAGYLSEVGMTYSVDSSVPKRKGLRVPMKPRHRAGQPRLVFTVDDNEQPALPMDSDTTTDPAD